MRLGYGLFLNRQIIKQTKDLEAELKNAKKYDLFCDEENTKELVVSLYETYIPVFKQDKTKKIINEGPNPFN